MELDFLINKFKNVDFYELTLSGANNFHELFMIDFVEKFKESLFKRGYITANNLYDEEIDWWLREYISGNLVEFYADYIEQSEDYATLSYDKASNIADNVLTYYLKGTVGDAKEDLKLEALKQLYLFNKPYFTETDKSIIK